METNPRCVDHQWKSHTSIQVCLDDSGEDKNLLKRLKELLNTIDGTPIRIGRRIKSNEILGISEIKLADKMYNVNHRSKQVE